MDGHIIKRISTLVETTQNNVWYALCIAMLALLSIGLLAYEFSPYATEEIVSSTRQIDLIIAWIFLTDFFAGLLFVRTVSRSTYFKYNWLNLLSSIPVSEDFIRILRIFRILRAFRIIRAAMNFWFAQSRYLSNKK